MTVLQSALKHRRKPSQVHVAAASDQRRSVTWDTHRSTGWGGGAPAEAGAGGA
eukprot:CAMPEP_0206150316 /NCGR_PEP_ID=MMETSP1473-20131121/38238_1 /ASSEMBLY_ACC=CAM_ASM_001109 /TAXON_ID=1461547 /ORGANISM="Stichococcus sp, Strain RCC1054" /LENGTH=52 /DNA_ID=CAMNT_0053547813 /DNA_START=475 /DNA_END=630 /DNA_ORIENTATION=-